MATETITDYETKEVTRTRTVCDMPSCTHTDEDVDMQELAVNGTHTYTDNFELCYVADDEAKATEVLDKRQYNEAVKDMGYAARGVGRRREPVDYQASATLDVCTVCLIEMLEIDIPNDEIRDVNFNTDSVEVEQRPPLITFTASKLIILAVIAALSVWIYAVF